MKEHWINSGSVVVSPGSCLTRRSNICPELTSQLTVLVPSGKPPGSFNHGLSISNLMEHNYSNIFACGHKDERVKYSEIEIFTDSFSAR